MPKAPCQLKAGMVF